MRERATTERPVSRPRSETWDTPTVPTAARPQRHEAGEVETKRRRRWWRMAEISEKTRLGMTIGGAALIAALVFGAGRFWGDWSATNRSRDATLARHDAELVELRKSVGEIKETIIRSEASQRAAFEAANRADGKGTAILLEMATLRETLAARGIISVRRPTQEE